MKVLSKQDILAAEDLDRELVEVPEWGGAVYVRTLTGTEGDAFEESILELRENGKGTSTHLIRENMRAKLLARCLVDEDGERLFADSEISQLGGKARKPIDRLFAVAQRLNGMGKDDIDELVGNSEGDPADTSSSSSQKSSATGRPAFSSQR